MKSFIAVVLVLVVSILAISPLNAAPQDYDTNGNNVIERDELLSAIRDHLFTDKLTRDELLVLIRLHLFEEPVVTEPRPELSGLSLTHGVSPESIPLSPAFSGTGYSYTASVGYEVVQLTVTAMGSDDATIMIVQNDDVTAQPDADIGTAGHQVTLMPGENVIRVKVVEGDSSQTYAITVTRSIPKVNVSTDTVMASEGAVLSFTLERRLVTADALEVMIDVSETGDFVDPGNEGIKTVTIAANSSTSIHTVPTDSDDDLWDPHSVVTVTLQPSDDYMVGDAGSAQTEVRDNDFPQATAALTVNPNPVVEGEQVTVSVTVTTDLDQDPHADGGFIEVSTLDGTAASPQDYAFLRESFIVDAAHFSAATVSGNNKYQATYAFMVSTVDDAMRENGETFTVQIAKSNADMITLASPSSVSVAVSESTDATLRALSLSGATLSPIFASATAIYTADVGNSVSSTTVTATPNDAGATAVIKIGGTEDPDGTVDLMEGANAITVEVTAENGVTTKIYTVAVARSATPDITPVLTVSELVTKVRASVVRINNSDSLGSGVIFDTSDQTGFIATNYHVVGLEEVVTVTVNDSTSYDGTVLGVDSVRDLAVISICCGNFTAVAFGDDDTLEIGTDVVAIGYALGLVGPATVTKGIVSRVFDDDEKMRKLIQTDAAINPGNSGGPLFTLDGLVVGINTSGYEYTLSGRPVEGVSFAISATTVQNRIPGLLSGHSKVPIYRDGDGALTHVPDELIELDYPAEFLAADVFAHARFTNPYDAAVNSWSYGFNIRSSNIFIGVVADIDNSYWFVYQDNAEGNRELVDGGSLDNLNTGYAGQNSIQIIAVGDTVRLSVNGEWVENVDLGEAAGPYYVGIFTGLFVGDEVSGAATRYENVFISPIYPTGFGPFAVELLHDDVRSYGAGYGRTPVRFWAADAEIEATFVNPYAAATAAWDYGLRFRHDWYSGEALLFYVYAGPNGSGWRLRNYDTDAILASGTLNSVDFNTGDGERNRLKVRAEGNTGMFYVNGVALGSFDISAVTGSGFVGVLTGYHNTVAGKVTTVEDFTASRIY